MTPREQSAFNAGVRAAREAALIAAVTLETRAGSASVRDRAAVEALQGLAEGLDHLTLGWAPDPMQAVFAAIAADPARFGETECPTCRGRLRWVRDSTNGHLHGECETAGCLRWME